MVSYPVYFIDITIWQQDKICKNDIPKYRVFFLTHSLSRLAHQKCFDWPPPKLSKCWNHIHFARHLGVFRSEGGPVWDSNVFLKSVTYRPTLSKFRGGPVKKNTLYEQTLFPLPWVHQFICNTAAASIELHSWRKWSILRQTRYHKQRWAVW